MCVSACSYWSHDQALLPIPSDQKYLMESVHSAIEEFDESPEVCMKKSELLISRGQVAEALQLFEKVEKKDVDILEWLWLQCKINHAIGNIQTSINAGEDLLALRSSFYELHTELADLYLQNNDPEKALIQINRAMYINPNDPVMYRRKGNIILEMKDTLTALELYGQAIHLGLKEESFLEAYVSLLIRSGQSSMAKSILDDLRRTDPDNPMITLIAAQIKFNENSFFVADNILYRNFILDNPDRSFFKLKWDIKMNLAQFDSVIYYTDLFLAKGPDKTAFQMRGKAYDKRYKYPEAISSYYQALKLDTADSNTHREIEILLRKIAYLRRIKEENQKEKSVIEPLTPVKRKF